MARKPSSSAQILLFPERDRLITTPGPPDPAPRYDVVLSGSFRKDYTGLKLAYEELRDLGCTVLSPQNVEVVKEIEGFVYMRGEDRDPPTAIQIRHMDAIQRSHLVWLHAPEGYVGLSAALEVGFARAIGIPVYCNTDLTDPILGTFVKKVSSPKDSVDDIKLNRLPVPPPAIRSFQHYYRRVASQRGYETESATDCLVLMVEEIGELARAIRKRKKLKRYGKPISADEAQELADVFLYVVHMANVLGLDLSSVVQAKEELNLKRFLGP